MRLIFIIFIYLFFQTQAISKNIDSLEVNGNKRISKEIVSLQPDYPQSYIASLASLDKRSKVSDQYVKKLFEKIPNFSSGMIKNFHSWIRPDQSEKLSIALKRFDI